MCAFCATNREESRARSARGSATEQPLPAPQPHVGTLDTHDRRRDLHGPSSSSQSQLEQRVGTVETLAQRLEQSLSQVLEENIDLREAVGSLQQELEQALQRVEELEATVENWQQWQEWQ